MSLRNKYLAPGFRALRRDWRSGELVLLAISLLIAAASISSVGVLSGRVARALERSAAQRLGGDLALSSDEPVRESILNRAAELGLESSSYRVLSSMASTDTGMGLVSLKAVDPSYPLRGELLL